MGPQLVSIFKGNGNILVEVVPAHCFGNAEKRKEIECNEQVNVTVDLNQSPEVSVRIIDRGLIVCWKWNNLPLGCSRAARCLESVFFSFCACESTLASTIGCVWPCCNI